MKRGGIFFISLFFCFYFSLLTVEGRAESYGTVSTGLLTLEKKYPYYLFVPPEYTPEKGWPLVVLLGDRDGTEPAELANQWLDWAKKNQLLLLVGSVFLKENSVPQEVDRWYLEIKKEVTERYHVLPSQILLLGIGTGAQYAAYMGLEHPEEFAGVALFRKAWPGPLEKMMKTKTDPKEQASFYVAVDPQGETFQAVEKKAAELEKKGYSITLDPLKAGEDLSAHRDRMIQWFLQETEARSARAKAKQKGGFKKTLREMRKNIFGN